MQLNPLQRGRSFVIVGVGWMCASTCSVFGEEVGVSDASSMLDVAVCVVM